MKTMPRLARAMGPVALSALAACAVGPDYRPATAVQLGVPDSFVSSSASPAPDLAMWWERFSDPVLTELTRRALVDNLDIAQAAARLRQARESMVQSRAQQLPILGLSGGAGRDFNHAAPDADRFSDQIDAQWSADLFGGLRRGAEASRATLEASGYGLADVRTAIAAEVARNYALQVPHVRVIDNKKNHGKGYSVRKGVLAAQQDWILFMDADNSTDISELDNFRQYLADYDILIASRALKQSKIVVNQNKIKVTLGRMGNLLIRLFIDQRIKDSQCGFKIFNNLSESMFTSP